MKVTVFALLLVAVSAYALPEEHGTDFERMERSSVTKRITAAIEKLKVSVIEAGWDPKVVDRIDFEYPSAVLVDIVAFIDSISFTGASNIVINNLSFNALLDRLRFDLSMPQVSVTVGNFQFSGRVMGDKITASLRGSLTLRRLGITGEARLKVGVISGTSIRRLEVNLSHPVVESKLSAKHNDVDISADVNKIFNVDVPNYLKANQVEIDRQLTDFIRAIADEALAKNAIIPEEIMYS